MSFVTAIKHGIQLLFIIPLYLLAVAVIVFSKYVLRYEIDQTPPSLKDRAWADSNDWKP